MLAISASEGFVPGGRVNKSGVTELMLSVLEWIVLGASLLFSACGTPRRSEATATRPRTVFPICPHFVDASEP